MTTTFNCPKRILKGGWREVVFYADCDKETELCPCGLDYAEECICPGPSEENVEYKEIKGILFGRFIQQ